ncbi:hypothetical protein TNCV_3380201 [Trichonephila clavipes]|nr:hypothetical protein TNCV_3380201 [Trichonephila clavipes]
MDAISRRYRKPKGRPSTRRSLCASKVQKRWEKITMQSDSDSTMCAKTSDILLAENSFMDTEISISDEGSHAGEKEQCLNASLSKLQMFPSTSTFCTTPRDDDSNCFDANKKLALKAFLKIERPCSIKNFSMAIGIHAMDKEENFLKMFTNCMKGKSVASKTRHS